MVKRTDPPQDNASLALQQTQRLLVWNAYHESLKEADRKILGQFQETSANLRTSLWVNVGIYIVQFLVVSLVLFYGLRQSMQSLSGDMRPWLVVLISLVLLGILLFRNPIRSIDRTSVNMARIQIILQGYNRQLQQIDAIFKQELLTQPTEMVKTDKSLERIQATIDGNVESLIQLMEEML